MRLPFRVAAAALLVAGTALVATAPAHAANPGFTAYGEGLQGTAGDDILILTINGFDLTHNRFAEGDPGFESAADFDPGTEGVQTRQLNGTSLQFYGAGGNDTIKVIGTFHTGLFHDLPNFIGGPGNDVLDFTELQVDPLEPGPNRGIDAGSSGELTTNYSEFETLRLTALDDHIDVDAYGKNPDLKQIETGNGNDYILGTDRSELIAAGSGNNEVNALGGNDDVTIAMPVTTADKPIRGGAGNDILHVRGTLGNDQLAIFSEAPYTYIAGDADSDAAYQVGEFETMAVGLDSGDDALYLEPFAMASVVDGGPGNDSVGINALRYPGSLTNQTFAIPGLPAVQIQNFEHPEIFNTLFAAAGALAGGAPHVRTFDSIGQNEASFYAYGENFHGGVNVATGDLDGDSVPEIVTAPGPGGGPHVRVFDRDGTPIGPGFYAYAPNFAGGVRVATGDLDGDGVEEIITVPQSSGGPHVRVFSAEGELLTEFFAEEFGNTGLTVAGGGTPSGVDEIIVGSGPGAPSLFATYWADGTLSTDPVSPFGPFTGGVVVASYEPAQTVGYRNGIAVGAGPGGNPHVRTFTHNASDGEIRPMQPVGSFYAFNEGFRGGVSLTGGTTGWHSPGTIIAGAGPGGGPHVRGLSATGVPTAMSFYAFGANFPGGINVGASNPRYPASP